MIAIHFVGVGEAFDPARGNTSVIIEGPTKLLVDCGYAVPALFFAEHTDPEYLDAIYITHFHADHTYGLPGLLARLHFDGRKKPLCILGQEGTEAFVRKIIQTGYPNIISLFGYELRFTETMSPVEFCGFHCAFAKTDHPMRNYAITLQTSTHKIGVSGDGGMTEESRNLFQDCTVLIHESFLLEESSHGHSYVDEVLEGMKTSKRLQTIAFVHFRRGYDPEEIKRYLAAKASLGIALIAPEPRDTLLIPDEKGSPR